VQQQAFCRPIDWWVWLLTGCEVKKWIFSLKMISDITVELQVPLSTIFSSVILHDYVELLANVAGHLNCYLNFSAQSWLLKC